MADPNILQDAVEQYCAGMTDSEFESFAAAVREPTEDDKGTRTPAKSTTVQTGRDRYASKRRQS